MIIMIMIMIIMIIILKKLPLAFLKETVFSLPPLLPLWWQQWQWHQLQSWLTYRKPTMTTMPLTPMMTMMTHMQKTYRPHFHLPSHACAPSPATPGQSCQWSANLFYILGHIGWILREMGNFTLLIRRSTHLLQSFPIFWYAVMLLMMTTMMKTWGDGDGGRGSR